MFVFSPWIGTSDVLPGTVGSGGAVISWFFLYSSMDWDASVLTGYGFVSRASRFVRTGVSYRILAKVGIGHR